MRSLSFTSSSFAFAEEVGARAKPASANAPTKNVAKRFLFNTFIHCLLFPLLFAYFGRTKLKSSPCGQTPESLRRQSVPALPESEEAAQYGALAWSPVWDRGPALSSGL